DAAGAGSARRGFALGGVLGTERGRGRGAQRRVAEDFDAATALAEGGDVAGDGVVAEAVGRMGGLGGVRGGLAGHASPFALLRFECRWPVHVMRNRPNSQEIPANSPN